MLHWTLAKTASKNTWTIYIYGTTGQSKSICSTMRLSRSQQSWKKISCAKKQMFCKKEQWTGGKVKKKLLIWWKVKTLHKATIEKQDLIGFKENRLKLLNSSPYRKKWVTREATALLNFFAEFWVTHKRFPGLKYHEWKAHFWYDIL